MFRRRRAWIAAREPPRAAIASQPARLRAVRLCSISLMGPRTLPSLYPDRAEGGGLEPPGAQSGRDEATGPVGYADRNPAPAPQQHQLPTPLASWRGSRRWWHSDLVG